VGGPLAGEPLNTRALDGFPQAERSRRGPGTGRRGLVAWLGTGFKSGPSGQLFSVVLAQTLCSGFVCSAPSQPQTLLRGLGRTGKGAEGNGSEPFP